MTYADASKENRISVSSVGSKCLHNFECNECASVLIEQFEVIQKFLELVAAARKHNMTISANAFAIKDLEKAFYADVKLSQEDSDRIWARIQDGLKKEGE